MMFFHKGGRLGKRERDFVRVIAIPAKHIKDGFICKCGRDSNITANNPDCHDVEL